MGKHQALRQPPFRSAPTWKIPPGSPRRGPEETQPALAAGQSAVCPCSAQVVHWSPSACPKGVTRRCLGRRVSCSGAGLDRCRHLSPTLQTSSAHPTVLAPTATSRDRRASGPSAPQKRLRLCPASKREERLPGTPFREHIGSRKESREVVVQLV